MCVRVTASITFCVCNNKSGVVARHATGEQYVKKQRIWEFHKKGNGRNKTKDRHVYKLHCRKHMKYCTKWLCKAIKNQKKEEENHLAAGKGLSVCVCICIGVCEPNCWNERLRHCSLGISPVTGTTCDASALSNNQAGKRHGYWNTFKKIEFEIYALAAVKWKVSKTPSWRQRAGNWRILHWNIYTYILLMRAFLVIRIAVKNSQKDIRNIFFNKYVYLCA